MKIYIAGPMRGYPDFNFPAFFKAAKKFRSEGHEVFNPADQDIKEYGDIFHSERGELRDIPPWYSIRKSLAWDMARICESEAIVLLPGWEDGSGTLAEFFLARTLGLKFIYLKDNNEVV